MRVEGKHRNLELAERHLRELSREEGGLWKIVSRTNADGEESARGRYFVFERVEKRKPIDDLDEYLEQIEDMDDEDIYYDEGESTADYAEV